MSAKSVTGSKVLSVSLLASVSALAAPAIALAEEEGGGGIGLLIPKMGEFLPALVAFLVLLLILGKFGWPIIVGALDKRAAQIKDDLEKAEANRIETERILAEHKAQLDEARVEAAQIIADAKSTGEAVKSEITAKAQQEAENMIAKANQAIEAQKKQAIAELPGSVADISASVAGRLIGHDLTDAEHLKLIERYVAEAGSLDAN